MSDAITAPTVPAGPVTIDTVERTLEELNVADPEQAPGAVVTQDPELNKVVAAVVATIFKPVPDTAFTLTYLWSLIRYTNLNSDGISAPIATDIGAALNFAAVQPMVENVTSAILTKYLGLIAPVSHLPRGQKLFQDATQAILGGSLIGAILGTITALNDDDDLDKRMAVEFAAAVPGLLLFTAIKIAMDVVVFRQKYQRVNANDPARILARETLKKSLFDFVDLRHLLINRAPKFTSLAIFTSVSVPLIKFWNERYGEGNLPQPLFMILFSYFFFSYNMLLNLAEVGHEIAEPQIAKFMDSPTIRRLLGRQDEGRVE